MTAAASAAPASAPQLGEEAREAAADAIQEAHDDANAGVYRWDCAFGPGDASRRVLAVLKPRVAALVEAARVDERQRLADLLLMHREAITSFVSDNPASVGDRDRLVELIAHLLRLRQEMDR